MSVTVLDLSRLSYSVISKPTKKKWCVEVGFLSEDDAVGFHDWLCRRSKKDKPTKEKAVAQAVQIADEINAVEPLSLKVRELIEQKFIEICLERNEQGRHAVELFDEVRRLRNYIGRANAAKVE